MLRPTFLAFETAKKALNVSQSGLDTVGHNISNVSTPGYTRQRVDQVSISSGGYKSKFQVYGPGSQFSGQGALVSGINQIRDPYLDTRYRNEASTYGELATKAAGLTDIQDVLDEISDEGMQKLFGNLNAAFSDLSSNASNGELAAVVRGAVESITKLLNQKASGLTTALETQKFDLGVSIENVNSMLEEIAYLNGKIREDHMFGNPSNELMDSRNLLIDQVAEYLPIKVVKTPEKITSDLTIENISLQLVDGTVTPPVVIDLVNKTGFNQLGVTTLEDGTTAISLLEEKTGFVMKENISNNITSGAVRGYIDIINGKGLYAGKAENNYRGIPYYQNMLDTFASKFADVMNEMNSISTSESNASGDPSLVTPYPNKNLLTAADGKSAVTAANISVSKAWNEDASYLTTSKLVEEPWETEKDDQGNTKYDEEGNIIYKKKGNNDNVLKFQQLFCTDAKERGTTHSFSIANGDNQVLQLFNGNFFEYLTNMSKDYGLDLATTTTMFEASNTVIGGYADKRDSISAVSVDEEAINMMTYQNYYNAAARYMTTLDEALGTIIQGMGVVGR